jgi:hypothetical protein
MNSTKQTEDKLRPTWRWAFSGLTGFRASNPRPPASKAFWSFLPAFVRGFAVGSDISLWPMLVWLLEDSDLRIGIIGLRDLLKVAAAAVVVYEVYKKIRRERGEEMAKLCVAQFGRRIDHRRRRL